MKRPHNRELAEAFRDGVDELYVWGAEAHISRPPRCWLSKHDDRSCSGRLERFHFIGRQRVRNALGALLPEEWPRSLDGEAAAFIALAEWDSRNGGIACEGHHRRFDGHLTPSLTVPADALPAHVIEFAEDWGLELEIERKFGERSEVAA